MEASTRKKEQDGKVGRGRGGGQRRRMSRTKRRMNKIG